MDVTELPDAGTDPAAEVLAASDLREKRIDAATGPRWYRYDTRRTPSIRAAAERDGPGRRVAYAVVPQDADHIVAEANPDHARAEVALWRGIAGRHAPIEWPPGGPVLRTVCVYCSAGQAVPALYPCADLALAVGAARAYLTGAQ